MNAGDLLTAMKRTVDQLAAFNTIAKALTSTLEVHEVLELVMQKVSELLRPRNWSLLLEDPRTGKLYFELAVGAGAEKLKELRLEPGEGIVGTVFKTAQARRVDDVRSDPSFAHRFDDISEFSTRSILAVPLVARGRAMGVIELVNGPQDPVFTQEDLHALLGIAEFAAIAIDNARNFQRIQELTITDEHTGLHNARHLQALLQQEVARAQRFQHPLSLLFMDLDRFKQVNDTYGHMYGSALLKEVGGLLQANIRQVDSAFRFGGDEFAVLLIETDVAGAQQTAQRIRDSVRERAFLKDRGLDVRLTLSVGVASFPSHATTDTELLQAADDAMYAVKAAGRDGTQLALPAEQRAARTPSRGVPSAGEGNP